MPTHFPHAMTYDMNLFDRRFDCRMVFPAWFSATSPKT
jgi:hypothetical protein